MTSSPSCCPTLQRLLSPALFKALSDPTRLGLLVMLADGGEERTVSALGGCCAVDLSVVSRHLKVLRDAGVIEARRHGKEVLYRVRASALASLLRGLADALEEAARPAAPIPSATGGTR